MTDINLLPWRETKRELEKKQFIFLLIISAVIALLIVFCSNFFVKSLMTDQSYRNQKLQDEIFNLDKELLEIRKLKKIKKALISRMHIVQNLQATRTLTIHLLDEIVKILPDGVYLTQVKREQNKVTLLGYAESNSNISMLMTNIEKNAWIKNPELTEIKKNEADNGSVQPEHLPANQFKLNFVMKLDDSKRSNKNGKQLQA